MLSILVLQIDETEDRLFMSKIYEKYVRLMFYIAGKWVDHAEEQEDIVQEALAKLMEKVQRLKELDEPQQANYISHTVRNTAIKHLEKKSRENRTLLEIDISDLHCATPNECFSLEERFIQKEWREKFKQIWDQLPERERLLLEGKDIFGETDEEIAQWLQCRPGSVRMALTRARRKVLDKMVRGEENAKSRSN